MRRMAGALVLTLAATAWSAVPGLAQAVQTASSVTAASVRADFDNDGFADLAVGVSAEDVGAIGDAGAVNVLYGGGRRAHQLRQPAVHPGQPRAARHRRGERPVRCRARRPVTTNALQPETVFRQLHGQEARSSGPLGPEARCCIWLVRGVL